MHLVFLLFFNVLALAATLPFKLHCIHGNFRHIEFSAEKIEPSAYCFDETHTRLISDNCYRNLSKCYAWKRDKKEKEPVRLAGQFGSPGFKLCRSYGGDPRLIDFQDGTKWYPLYVCTFSDKSFVNTGLLFYLEK